MRGWSTEPATTPTRWTPAGSLAAQADQEHARPSWADSDPGYTCGAGIRSRAHSGADDDDGGAGDRIAAARTLTTSVCGCPFTSSARGRTETFAHVDGGRNSPRSRVIAES